MRRGVQATALVIALLVGICAPVGAAARAQAKDPFVPVGASPARGLGKPLGRSAPRRLVLEFLLKTGRGGTPKTAALREVRSWLRAHSLTARSEATALKVTTTTTIAARLLHVRFSIYELSGHRYYASTTPKVPRAVASELTGILGLTNKPVAAPLDVRIDRSDPSPANPLQAPKAEEGPRTAPSDCGEDSTDGVDGDSLVEVGEHYGNDWSEIGTGTTVAVIELAASYAPDIATYDECFGISSSNVTVADVDGGASIDWSGSGSVEADLDIEQVQTQAPGAKVISYEAPNTPTGWYDVFAHVVDQDTASVISVSWGSCEYDAYDSSDPSDPNAAVAIEPLLEQAESQGQDVFVASGDSGSSDCAGDKDNPPAPSVDVDYPASSPYVTAVGGTEWVGDADEVWHDGSNAGGGGVSRIYAEPSWQVPVVGTLSGRGVPDISLDANGNQIIYDDHGWDTGGGTSFAAPLAAGLLADADETCSAPIADFNEDLYTWFEDNDYDYGSLLNDVTTGDNDIMLGTMYYEAHSGYDLASGLGTIDTAYLGCPNVTSVSPASFSAGNTITITGTYLYGATVKLGSTAASVTSSSATTLVVQAPFSGTTNDLTVSNVFGEGIVSPQSITFTSSPPSGAVYSGTDSGTYEAAASGGASGNPVTFSVASSSGTTCTINGDSVTYGAASGTCTILASQEGNYGYGAASASQSFVVAPATQAVSFTSMPPFLATVGETYTPSATGGGSGNPVVLSVDPSSSSGACTMSAGTVSFSGAGSCVIDANQQGSSNYLAAAQVQQDIAIAKLAVPVIHTTSVEARGELHPRSVPVSLSCTNAPCTIRAQLSAKVTVLVKRTVIHDKKKTTKTVKELKAVVIGAKTVHLNKKGATTVLVVLNARGRSLLSKAAKNEQRTSVKLVATVGAVSRSKAIIVVPPKKKATKNKEGSDKEAEELRFPMSS